MSFLALLKQPILVSQTQPLLTPRLAHSTHRMVLSILLIPLTLHFCPCSGPRARRCPGAELPQLPVGGPVRHPPPGPRCDRSSAQQQPCSVGRWDRRLRHGHSGSGRCGTAAGYCSGATAEPRTAAGGGESAAEGEVILQSGIGEASSKMQALDAPQHGNWTPVINACLMSLL